MGEKAGKQCNQKAWWTRKKNKQHTLMILNIPQSLGCCHIEPHGISIIKFAYFYFMSCEPQLGLICILSLLNLGSTLKSGKKRNATHRGWRELADYLWHGIGNRKHDRMETSLIDLPVCGLWVSFSTQEVLRHCQKINKTQFLFLLSCNCKNNNPLAFHKCSRPTHSTPVSLIGSSRQYL